MNHYRLFDSVKLKETITLSNGEIVKAETIGAIVEVFNQGEAYLIELFGKWVKYDEKGNFIPALPQEKGAFQETIEIETVYPHQIELIQKASDNISVRGHLLSLIDELSAEKVAEVRDFAESLLEKPV